MAVARVLQHWGQAVSFPVSHRHLLSPALAVVIVLVAALIPGTLTTYRCRMTGDTRSAPCCAHEDRAHATPGAPNTEVNDTACCAKLSLLTTLTPAAAVTLDDGAHDVIVAAAPAPARPPILAITTRRPVWTRAHFDSGASLSLLYCSLLI